ncbi:MAG: tetratricopeptide repeat protein [Gammaproteobacteria bacterium]
MKRLIQGSPILLLCLLLAHTPACPAAHGGEHTFVSPVLYKKLKKSEELIAKKNYTAARDLLQGALDSAEKGGFEEATLLRSLASVYALAGQYGKAADALSKCLALNALPEKQAQQALLNLGQLYLATDQYRKAVDTLEKWLSVNRKADPDTYILLANAYAQLKQYRKALPYVDKAIRSSSAPKEEWLKLGLALHYELKNYREAAGVLRKLMRLSPDNKEYWNQAVSVHQQLKEYAQAATLKHLAYRKGLLTEEKEILALVNLFLFVDAPYKAAALLEKEIKNGGASNSSKNWELLANAWTEARELDKAVDALRTASKMNAKGELYLRLGYIYVEQEKWDKASEALGQALVKGGLREPGNAYIMLGISQTELKNFKQARRSFAKAREYPKTRKTAEQWLNYIDESGPSGA